MQDNGVNGSDIEREHAFNRNGIRQEGSASSRTGFMG
jgi:hypothetical protein